MCLELANTQEELEQKTLPDEHEISQEQCQNCQCLSINSPRMPSIDAETLYL